MWETLVPRIEHEARGGSQLGHDPRAGESPEKLDSFLHTSQSGARFQTCLFRTVSDDDEADAGNQAQRPNNLLESLPPRQPAHRHNAERLPRSGLREPIGGLNRIWNHLDPSLGDSPACDALLQILAGHHDAISAPGERGTQNLEQLYTP